MLKGETTAGKKAEKNQKHSRGGPVKLTRESVLLKRFAREPGKRTAKAESR